jgi:Leucine-rich repeat (LRR) protein
MHVLHDKSFTIQTVQIEKLEDVAGTLEELWVSYNQISALDGLSACTQLTTLYVSNNLIKSWAELDKIVSVWYILRRDTYPVC